jgi:hypothetical protein
MIQEQQESTKNALRQGGRWLRIGVLTLTTVGPIVNSLVGRMRSCTQGLREGSMEQVEASSKAARSVQAETMRRLDDFTTTSRRAAAEQAKQLQRQARQLREQARVLRKALRKETEQRRQLQKVVTQLQKAGVDWSGAAWKRGGALTDMIAAQSGKLSQEVIERSNELSHNLTERGQQLVQVGRKQDRTFWTVFGFSVGLVAAATVTILLIRKRIEQQETGEDEQIVLPQHQNWAENASSNGRPVGEILHIEGNIEGNGATPGNVEVASVTMPEEATFVGFISTKYYYPRELFRDRYPTLNNEITLDDLIFFLSEEDAQAQGFSREQE